MQLFVPGRICLFGEHSDWAGGYRRINAAIESGAAIITGTNQGIHAQVRPHPGKLILHTTLEDGTRPPPFEVAMEPALLLEAAQAGGFYSYAAGVAYQVMIHYRVRGLVIENDHTDLPVKKGLSSSAAVCVLVARAFNRLYDLKLTVRGEMELAYLGEITTPSRCGRLDQGCAYGPRPILMQFDGDRIDVEELTVGGNIQMIVVDLKASKNTREILNRLNHCYPFAETELQRKVQHYLGPINRDLVTRASQALRAGDAATLGALMTEAQALFDTHLQPACPAQLTAPVLHRLLTYPALQPLLHGGKGVGSQGDGSAQLIARNETCRDAAIQIIEHELGMACLPLVLRSGGRVRKAVIPAAGFGTRHFPATKAVKKELFPVVGHDGRTRPAILTIVEEALAAGIEEVAVLVQPDDRELFQEIFCCPPPIENYNKLSRTDQQYCDYLLAVGRRITFLAQASQEGFGHAVYSAREWVGQEPFLLMLGDHLYTSDTPIGCAKQLIQTFERTNRSVVGLLPEPASQVHHFGCVTGNWNEMGHMLDITAFVEKPDADYAREHLSMVGLPDDHFLTVFGQYVLKPEIFTLLGENIRRNLRERGEFQLTSCLDQLRRNDGFLGQIVQGQRYDIGTPAAYLASLQAFSATPVVHGLSRSTSKIMATEPSPMTAAP
jgi:UTP-glucose-1-phosphate uridylyltransferase/mevalonate kinase